MDVRSGRNEFGGLSYASDADPVQHNRKRHAARLQKPRKTLREQLRQVTKSYESAMKRLENPSGSLKESNDVLDTVMARPEAAEEEVKKYKKGKAAQDGRIKDLHVENAALKRNALGELEAAENTANMNDKVRATTLTDELVNRHYGHLSRIQPQREQRCPRHGDGEL